MSSTDSMVDQLVGHLMNFASIEDKTKEAAFGKEIVSSLSSSPGLAFCEGTSRLKDLAIEEISCPKDLELCKRTGYKLTITANQRLYGGPPPNSEKIPQPGKGCQVFIGRIPYNLLEDTLVPLLSKFGTIWSFRLLMNGNLNRGYGFVLYTTAQEAIRAETMLDNYEIVPGMRLKVQVSEPNDQLYVCNIPKNKTQQEIFAETKRLFGDSVTEVITYANDRDLIQNQNQNRRFCFIRFENHKFAAAAKKRLKEQRFLGCPIVVDWARPLAESRGVNYISLPDTNSKRGR